MHPVHDVSVKMEKIREVFEYANSLVESEEDINLIIEKLHLTDTEFRSIAYEGASREIALKNLTREKSLTTWIGFINMYAQDHLAQAYTGLGCALTSSGRSTVPFLGWVHPLTRNRVIDGCGYYDGIFKSGI